MSLQRAKRLYYIAIIAIALLLLNAGNLLYSTATIVLLGGALPFLRLIIRYSAREALTMYRNTHHEVYRHTPTTNQNGQDHLEAIQRADRHD